MPGNGRPAHNRGRKPLERPLAAAPRAVGKLGPCRKRALSRSLLGDETI